MISSTIVLLGLGYAASIVSALAIDFPPNSLDIRPNVVTRQATTHDNTEALLINNFGDASQMPEQTAFEFFGPFSDVTFEIGSTNLKGIKVTDLAGKVSEYQGVGSIETKKFTFDNNERISEIIMVLSQDSASASSEKTTPFGVGVKFKTNGGNSFDVEPAASCKALAYSTLKVGSGIIGRIHGVAASGTIYELGIDMVDELSSIAVTDLQYSGFTDNVAPAGAGQRLVVGSLIVDNLNSSSAQSVTIQTTSTVSSSRTIDFSMSYQVGQSIAIKAGVSIPLVAEAENTVTTSWQLTTTTGESTTTSETKTDSATFPVVCSTKKYCTASAFFNQYKLDVDISAQFAATTLNDKVFNWVQNGTYKGADGTTVKTTVNEYSEKQ